MPKLASDIYATYRERVLKLAAKEGGVSRPQIMESLNVSRSVADTMIEKCDLKVARREGRTEYFVLPGTTVEAPQPAAAPVEPEVPPLAEKDADVLPPEVEEAGVVEPNPLDRLADVVETDDQVLAALDKEIAETRTALREAATKAGKAMADWALNQGVVDTLRDRMGELVGRRVALSGLSLSS